MMSGRSAIFNRPNIRRWVGVWTMLTVWGVSWLCAARVFSGNGDAIVASRAWVFLGAWGLITKLLAVRSVHFSLTWSRLVTFAEFVQLASAAIVSLCLTLPALAFLYDRATWMTVVVLDAALAWGTLSLLCALPRAWKEWRRHRRAPGDRRRVLIWGTSDAEVLLLRSLKNHPDDRFLVVGFVGESQREVSERIDGVPIVASLRDWVPAAVRLGVDELFVVSGTQPGDRIREISREADDAQVKMQVLPNYHQLLSGDVRVVPRPVSIEDLLQRKPIELHSDVLTNWLRGRRVLVTGGAGSIGAEIARQILAFAPSQVILLDRSEHGIFELEQEHCEDPRVVTCLADITDEERLTQVFARHRPEIVFHAAAYKHVPILEAYPQEAVRNIVGATINVARVSERFRVESLVFVSTDKAVAPSSVMGACKRVAERYLQAVADDGPTRMVAVRFGNVLDSAGSVVPVFRNQLARGGPVTVTHPEMRRFFMTIPEAAQLVLHAGAMGRGGEIFVLKMGRPIRIVDLARDLIRLSGLEPEVDVPIHFTGLRPGEKLEEQLADRGEQLGPTSHPEIEVVQTSPLPRAGFAFRAAALVQAARQSEGLLERIEELVPEYTRSVEDRHEAPAAA